MTNFSSFVMPAPRLEMADPLVLVFGGMISFSLSADTLTDTR
jgi:hypothetical protein